MGGMSGQVVKPFASHCCGLPLPRVDHGIMVFHGQPWLTMVIRALTVVSDHGANYRPDHGHRVKHGQTKNLHKIHHKHIIDH